MKMIATRSTALRCAWNGGTQFTLHLLRPQPPILVRVQNKVVVSERHPFSGSRPPSNIIKCIIGTWPARNCCLRAVRRRRSESCSCSCPCFSLATSTSTSTRFATSNWMDSLVCNEEITKSWASPPPEEAHCLTTPHCSANVLTAHLHLHLDVVLWASWWLKTRPHCGLVISLNEWAAVSGAPIRRRSPEPNPFQLLFLHTAGWKVGGSVLSYPILSCPVPSFIFCLPCVPIK